MKPHFQTRKSPVTCSGKVKQSKSNKYSLTVRCFLIISGLQISLCSIVRKLRLGSGPGWIDGVRRAGSTGVNLSLSLLARLSSQYTRV